MGSGELGLGDGHCWWHIRNVRAWIWALIVSPALAGSPEFYRDVLPILQNRCQICHRPGQVAPMEFRSYAQTRPWAKAIREAVRSRKMPPWFADPRFGKFANDRRLTDKEIETLAEWADQGAKEGDRKDAPEPRTWPDGWQMATRDVIVQMAQPFTVPAKGAVEYQYFAVPTGFTRDRWVQAVEVKPGAPSVIHHIVVYIREKGSSWTRGPTKADILSVYAPGSGPDEWPKGMAKLIPEGADLVFEIHYTPKGQAVADRTQAALKLTDSLPEKRVLTLQLNNDHFRIPPGEANWRVSAWGTLPNDALLLSFFPHMHLRGKTFEYSIDATGDSPRTLLRVDPYNFYWQLSYRLAAPIPLPKGTRLMANAWYDNSANNPLNPDPKAEIRYGEQSWEEMMIGFFDVAVDRDIDKAGFFNGRTTP